MKSQNRPYSANDVCLNLQKKIGKTQVIKSMEQLAQEEKLIEKVYGKVFFNLQLKNFERFTIVTIWSKYFMQISKFYVQIILKSLYVIF